MDPMPKRPKPPKVEPPKIVPGKETARSIGIDTAFIDGLAAGLVDEADLPPPPPARKVAVEAAPAPAPAPAAAPARGATARKPPLPKGLSERSGPLFRVQEPEKKDDEDPLAALLEGLPAESGNASAGSFVAPKPKDDLLARLAAKDDADGAVSLAPPPPPKKKGASESSGSTLAAKGTRSETSGNMPLPKGSEAPVFDPGPKAAKEEAAKPEAAKVEAAPSKKAAEGEAAPKREVPQKPKPKKDESGKAAEKRVVVEAPPAAVAATGGALASVHPGVWMLLAAVFLGIVLPILGGSDGGDDAATKSDAARHVPEKKKTMSAADQTSARAAAAGGEAQEADVEEEPAAEPEEEAPAEEEEELVEIEEEAAGAEGAAKGTRKANGGGDDQKNASQLLNDAKAAYSQGRNGDAYRLAGQSNRQRGSEDALTVRAKAACRMGNENAAKKAFEDLPMGNARREVRPICRDKGIRLGI